MEQFPRVMRLADISQLQKPEFQGVPWRKILADARRMLLAIAMDGPERRRSLMQVSDGRARWPRRRASRRRQ